MFGIRYYGFRRECPIHMVSAIRDFVFALIYIHRTLPSAHTPSVNSLPESLTSTLCTIR
jgi:hypothetical protein